MKTWRKVIQIKWFQAIFFCGEVSICPRRQPFGARESRDRAPPGADAGARIDRQAGNTGRTEIRHLRARYGKEGNRDRQAGLGCRDDGDSFECRGAERCLKRAGSKDALSQQYNGRLCARCTEHGKRETGTRSFGAVAFT